MKTVKGIYLMTSLMTILTIIYFLVLIVFNISNVVFIFCSCMFIMLSSITVFQIIKFEDFLNALIARGTLKNKKNARRNFQIVVKIHAIACVVLLGVSILSLALEIK